MGTLTTVVSSENEEDKNSPLTFDDRGYVGNAGEDPHPLIEQLSRRMNKCEFAAVSDTRTLLYSG